MDPTQDQGAAAQDRHVPVLLDRCVDLLAPALRAAGPGAVFVDGTLGMGGHTEAVLRACPQARAVGVDRDPQALELATARLAPFGERFVPVHEVSDDLPATLHRLGLSQAHAILYDLGVSSLQLDELDRGFAYRADAPLDMRMDQSTGVTAADVLNDYDVRDLARILRDYGEERFASSIAKAIVRRREQQPFTTSGPLVAMLHEVVPAASRRTGGHPAKRTFQALRIEVNAELAVWRDGIAAALRALAVHGRIVVLSYHSLEDRITKRALVAGATSSAPPGLPVELPEHQPWLRLLTRGAERADEAEQARNPRSASVRLRAAERLRSTDSPPAPPHPRQESA